MIKVLLVGANGRMGVEIQKLLAKNTSDMVFAGGIDAAADGYNSIIVKSFDDCKVDADVIIDFSHHSTTNDLLKYAISKKLPCVISTTGQTEEEKKAIIDASKIIPIFHSANMSIGIAILADFARKVAAYLPDANIEIVEKHHNQKLDAPSGTALMIADSIKKSRQEAEYVYGRHGHGKRTDNEIGIHALRLGNIVGEHEVIINTGNEAITLKHEAYSRSLFADGALTAAEFLVGKPAGMYDMNAIVVNKG